MADDKTSSDRSDEQIREAHEAFDRFICRLSDESFDRFMLQLTDRQNIERHVVTDVIIDNSNAASSVSSLTLSADHGRQGEALATQAIVEGSNNRNEESSSSQLQEAPNDGTTSSSSTLQGEFLHSLQYSDTSTGATCSTTKSSEGNPQ